MLGMRLIVGGLVCSMLSACGAVQQGDKSTAKNQAATATKPASSTGTNTSTGTANPNQGTISMTIAVADSSAAIAGSKLIATLTPQDGVAADTRVVSEDFVNGKTLQVAGLVAKSYSLSLQLIDQTGNLLAAVESAALAVSGGGAVALKVNLTQSNNANVLTIDTVAPSDTNEEFANWVTKYECWTTNSIPPAEGCTRTVLQLSKRGHYRLFREDHSSAGFNTLPEVATLPDNAMIASGIFTTNQLLVADGPTVTITFVSQVTLLGISGTQNDADMANSNQTCGVSNWRLGNFIYFKGPVPADPACQALVQGKSWPDLAQAKLTATAQIKSALPAKGIFEPAEPESLQLNLLVEGLPLYKGFNQFYRVNSR